MAKKKTPEFYQMTKGFFLTYLPNQRNFSDHTIRAYQISINQLAEFTAKQHNIRLWNVDFHLIDSVLLSQFLDYVEATGSSIATRNQRLKGIRAFYSYSAMMHPILMSYRADIYKVPFKKEPTELIIDHLSEDAIKALLAVPDAKTKKGLRNRFLLAFMYDSAARVQEVVDVKLKDIRSSKNPVVILHGKGDKIRNVPLMEKTMEQFKAYCKVFHPNEGIYSERPLFYTERKGCVTPINESTIRKILVNCGETIKKDFPEITGSIHPHLLRHNSRAMHLYQHGMELTLISQWLGHAHLDTTLIYAHADTEHKRTAIAKATHVDSPLAEKLNADRYVVSDDEVLKRLYGLK